MSIATAAPSTRPPSTTTYAQLTEQAARCIARASVSVSMEVDRGATADRVGRRRPPGPGRGPGPPRRDPDPAACPRGNSDRTAPPRGPRCPAAALAGGGGPGPRLERAESVDGPGAALAEAALLIRSAADLWATHHCADGRPRSPEASRMRHPSTLGGSLPGVAHAGRPDREGRRGPGRARSMRRRSPSRRWPPCAGSRAHEATPLVCRDRGPARPDRGAPRRPARSATPRGVLRPRRPAAPPGVDAGGGRQRPGHGAREPRRDRDRAAPGRCERAPVAGRGHPDGPGPRPTPARQPPAPRRASPDGARSPTRSGRCARHTPAPTRSRSSDWTSTAS